MASPGPHLAKHGLQAGRQSKDVMAMQTVEKGGGVGSELVRDWGSAEECVWVMLLAAGLGLEQGQGLKDITPASTNWNSEWQTNAVCRCSVHATRSSM